ncbi:MAG: extracellular solute-binding protein [Deinococcota bacterium]|nr:extracellular solute-binding protein [Deinococcota bacterium]
MTKKIFLLLITGLMSLYMSGMAQQPSGTVVWITPAPISEIEEQITAFNALYPNIRVETLFMGVGELTTRLRAEAANPQTDVASDVPVSYIRQNPDLFRSHVSEHDDAFPDDVKDAETHTWYGHYGGPQIFMVNTNLLDEADAPRTWADLADPRYRGEIIMANPALSSSAFSQLYVMLEVGGWELVEAVLQNAVITPSSRLAWQGVADGEYAIGMVTESTAINLVYEEYPVMTIYPEDGTNNMVTGLALVENSPNAENAELLFEFLNSREAHEMVAGPPYFRRSARPDVELHESMLPTAEINFILTVDDMISITAEEHTEILERFDELMAGM